MEIKEVNPKELVRVRESALLSLVASKLKDRVLFPQKNEDAKNYMKNVKFANS